MYGTSNGSKRVCVKARDLGYWVKYTVCASPEHTWYGQIEGNAFFDEIDGLGGGEGGSEEELARDQHSASLDRLLAVGCGAPRPFLPFSGATRKQGCTSRSSRAWKTTTKN